MSRVLIIDDDKGILESLRAVLEFEGLEVYVVDSSDNLHGKIIEIVPDVILLDLLLADKSGKDVVVSLRADLATCDVPIIMLSAYPGAKKEAVDCGADDFLAKPFDIDELIGKIKEHI